MPADIYQLPRKIIAGDTISFSVKGGEYPSSAYKLAYSISGSATHSTAAVANGNGVDFDIVLASKDTSIYPPGRYAAALVFTGIENSDRHTVRVGSVFVYADPTRQRAKMPCEVALENIEATIVRLTEMLNTATSIAGQSATRLDLEKAFTTRNNLRVVVAQERRKIGEFDTTGGLVTLRGRFR